MKSLFKRWFEKQRIKVTSEIIDRDSLYGLRHRNNQIPYLEEIRKPWPGMENDINFMQDLIAYAVESEGGYLRLFEGMELEDDEIILRRPEWFDLCKDYFGGRYEKDIYEIMFEKGLVTMMDRYFIFPK